MQLVSKKILKELMQSKLKFEGEKASSLVVPTFKDILTQMRKFIDEGKRLTYPGQHIPRKPNLIDEINYAYEMMISGYLKKNHKFIQYIDKGSSRTVFALSGGKCLKIAQSKKGIAQNKQEVLNSQNKYSCFPILYEFDDRDFSMILVECCAQLDSGDDINDLKNAYGDPQLSHMIAAIHDIVNVCNCDIDEAIKMLQYADEYGKYAYGRQNDEYGYDFAMRKSFCMRIKDDSAPQFEVLRQLVKFYSDHGCNDDQCLLVDLEGTYNWGLAVREGTLVPIVIDAGFSEAVREQFY